MGKDCFESLIQQELHVTKLPLALPLAGMGQIEERLLGACSSEGEKAMCTVKGKDTWGMLHQNTCKEQCIQREGNDHGHPTRVPFGAG